MKTVCKKDKCAGCMACLDICPTSSIRISDELHAYNAIIDERTCINCGACERVCQEIKPTKLMKTIDCKQGWAKSEFRSTSSSGGFASAISYSFIRNGGYVASCKLEHGNFVFSLTNNVEDLKMHSGSKYVKSNPSGIYKSIKKKLLENEKVLFIGLPCQVSALRNFTKTINGEKLYTIDLICHGTPSPFFIKTALNEYGYNIEKMNDLFFRNHNKFGLRTCDGTVTHEKVRDRYLIAFLKGLFYTENCYSCKYATQNRSGDLTLGDSWGTSLVTEEKNGISLALIQNEKGRELLNIANLNVFDVDYNTACNANHQLLEPSTMPNSRSVFFENISKGMNFKKAVKKAYPKICWRQDIKNILINIGMFK